ncbi:unnamed protein product [Brassica napus]|uniref:(rape) hypothetical protein n=1 Tax=Brassica napus TaxID=3708 RepID=A0A816SFP4_BRANA|nr:unnamed protein product [Brassica napus]CAF2198396.1 unnamed protein product [Brassica napus]CAF2242445.1 unnamed protein product [Brassica napus]
MAMKPNGKSPITSEDLSRRYSHQLISVVVYCHSRGAQKERMKQEITGTGTNGRVGEPVHGSIGKNRDVTEEKSSFDLAETKYGNTVEKRRVKNMVLETLFSAKIEGFVDGFRGETKAASTEKTVDK